MSEHSRTSRAPLVLGTWSAGPGTGLWEQALPAAHWRTVLGDAVVKIGRAHV